MKDVSRYVRNAEAFRDHAGAGLPLGLAGRQWGKGEEG
jgi:hypothetical protein